MKKCFCLLLASVFAIGTVLSGCQETSAPTSSSADQSTPVSEAKPEKVYEFTMGTSYDAKSPPAVAAAKFIEDVKTATNGQIIINFHTNSAIGSEKDQYIAVAGNELDFTLSGVLGLDMYAPEYGFFSAPYLFSDMEHVRRLMESEVGDGMKEAFTKNNLRPLAICYRGVRNTSSELPINQLEDLAGLKIRMSETPSWVAIWGEEGLGATPIPIALGELYNALQTGVVSASEGPYEQLATYKFYEVQKYLVNTNHVYEWCALFMSDKVLQSLPEDLQTILIETAEKDIGEYGTQLCTQSVSQYHQELLDGGMEELNPDLAPFREKVLPVYEKFFKEHWTASSYEEVLRFAK